jgi:succinyl-diaminopimelate desuccinylase
MDKLDKLYQLVTELCDIESVSGNEQGVADYVEGFLRALEYLEVSRIGNCVVARTNYGRKSRVVLAGHLDTVPISRRTSNLPTRRKVVEAGSASAETKESEEFIWGRGTVDMKAGDAVFMYLAAVFAGSDTDPKYDITYIFYDNEEVSGDLNGLLMLSNEHPDLLKCDFAILGEPTDSHIEAGCNGSLRFDIPLHGKAAHSARGWKGENAIHKAEAVLHLLNAWNSGERHLVEVEGLAYTESLNATLISGGIATNVIPDECKVHVNYRFAPDKTTDDAQQVVAEIFAGYELDYKDISAPARPGLSLSAVQEFVEHNQRLTGLGVSPKLGWTDVSRFSALGIPALNYGPGDAFLAHHDEEQVALSSIDTCFQVLYAFLST